MLMNFWVILLLHKNTIFFYLLCSIKYTKSDFLEKLQRLTNSNIQFKSLMKRKFVEGNEHLNVFLGNETLKKNLT